MPLQQVCGAQGIVLTNRKPFMAKGKELLTDGRLAILLVVVILIIDQVIKIEVKTSMSLGEALHVTDWFYIDFVENNGMAYGMTFINKLLLSILRLVAIAVISRYIWKVVKQGMRTRYVVFLSMILAGAMRTLRGCDTRQARTLPVENEPVDRQWA